MISAPVVMIRLWETNSDGGGRQMDPGKLVFAQIMDFMPRHDFDACVPRYDGDRRLRGFSCRDQFLCLAFTQLTFMTRAKRGRGRVRIAGEQCSAQPEPAPEAAERAFAPGT